MITSMTRPHHLYNSNFFFFITLVLRDVVLLVSVCNTPHKQNIISKLIFICLSITQKKINSLPSSMCTAQCLFVSVLILPNRQKIVCSLQSTTFSFTSIYMYKQKVKGVKYISAHIYACDVFATSCRRCLTTTRVKLVCEAVPNLCCLAEFKHMGNISIRNVFLATIFLEIASVSFNMHIYICDRNIGFIFN